MADVPQLPGGELSQAVPSDPLQPWGKVGGQSTGITAPALRASVEVHPHEE